MPQGQEDQQTILLIVADNSLRRLITLGLQYRGMCTIEASSPNTLPADKLEECRPDLLVLDVDSGVYSDWSLLELVQEHHYLADLPLIVLAWENLPPPDFDGELGEITCLTKPFDARTLHAKIEHLLATSKQRVASASAAPEAAPVPPVPSVPVASPVPSTAVMAAPAAYAAGAASGASIWPFITAFGLLLAMIGLMVQITLTGIGILIILAGLLWWTLGTTPEPPALPVKSSNYVPFT